MKINLSGIIDSSRRICFLFLNNLYVNSWNVKNGLHNIFSHAYLSILCVFVDLMTIFYYIIDI